MKTGLSFLFLLTASTLVLADAASIYKRCSACHGENAEKKSLGVSAVIAGWKEDKIIEKLKGYKSKKLNQYGFGNMMSGQAVKLDETQMREVAKYVSKLSVPSPQIPDTNSSEPTLTPEQLAYKKFVQDYFISNPKGTIREADKLWEESRKK